jgi:hypothetical protein
MSKPVSQLSELLATVDAMFPKTKSVIDQFSFSLNRYQRGMWGFTVTDNWYKWSDAKYEHQFALYGTPEDAIQAFLDYVRKNKIDVKKLAGEP